jgi:hypothetical protein
MNPKDVQGSAKPNLSVLPLAPLLEVIAALTEGRRKYGPWNWRSEKVSETIYADAAIRHLMQFIAGEDMDQDSGVHHISKAIAGLLVVRDAQLHGCSIDDRQVNQNLNINAIKEQIAGVFEKYPEPSEAEQSLAEAVDEVFREFFEDAENQRPDILLSDDMVGATVVNLSGNVSKLRLNKGSERYPFAYLDGSILRTVDKYGRYTESDDISYLDIVEVRPSDVARSWSDTVAGGGSYVIKREDIGKTIVLRNGSVGTITEFDNSKWPVLYEGEDGGVFDCTTYTGFASHALGYEDDPGSAILDEIDTDIVRVYHKGAP